MRQPDRLRAKQSTDSETRRAESDLIRRAQAGDGDAVAELYRAHSPAVFRYFTFRISDVAAAEDLTAEVFLKMVAGLPGYQDRGLPLAAWLFRIAHDRAVDYRRRLAVRQAEPLDEAVVDRQANTEVEAIRRTESKRMRALLAKLTDEQQDVVLMRFVEGLSLEQTAQALGRSVGAVKAAQHRALRRLGQLLRDTDSDHRP